MNEQAVVILNDNNTKNIESLSLLMDNEASGSLCQEAINKVLNDKELSQKWSRFHLARELLIEKEVYVGDQQFAENVANVVDAEPHRIGAVDWHKKSQQSQSNNWYRRVVGFAVAASVTALVVTGVNNFAPNLEKMTPKTQYTSHFAPILDNVVPASAGFQVPSKVPDLQDQQRLQRLFLQHTLSASENGLKGFLPYAKVVSYRRIPTKVAELEQGKNSNISKESQSGSKDIDSNIKP